MGVVLLLPRLMNLMSYRSSQGWYVLLEVGVFHVREVLGLPMMASDLLLMNPKSCHWFDVYGVPLGVVVLILH